MRVLKWLVRLLLGACIFFPLVILKFLFLWMPELLDTFNEWITEPLTNPKANWITKWK